MTTGEAAKKWNVSTRYVQKLLASGRIEGAEKISRSWMIPADAEKPDGAGTGEVRAQKGHLESPMLINSIRFIPGSLEEKINSMQDSRKRHQVSNELAYLRGDFEAGLQEYRMTSPTNPMRVYILNLACLCAISTGDYTLFRQIDGELREKAQHRDLAPSDKKIIDLSVLIARASMYANDSDVSMDDVLSLPASARSFGFYLYVKTLHQEGKYDRLIGVAQTVLAQVPEGSCSIMEIYLSLLCGGAFLVIGDMEGASLYLRKSLEMGLSDGLTTPYAELYTIYPGMFKPVLQADYPQWFPRILKQCQQTLANWIEIHNEYAKDHVTSILTVEEYNIAVFAASGKTNAQIAENFNMSISSVKKKLEGIYAKLLISSRQELSEFVRWNSD